MFGERRILGRGILRCGDWAVQAHLIQQDHDDWQFCKDLERSGSLRQDNLYMCVHMCVCACVVRRGT